MIYSAEEVIMNTIIRISIVSSRGTIFTNEKLYKAFSFFNHVVDKFSRFNIKSELSLLNARKISEVSLELFNLIEIAIKASKISDGVYDPTIIDLLEAYGYDKNSSFKGLDNPKIYDEIKKLCKNRPSVNEIELDKNNLTVKLALNQKIDLGSVAKGYAVDLAFNFLQKYKFDGILINAGGDIRCSGVNEFNLPWSIALYKADLPNSGLSDNKVWGKVELQNESISGSGGWARKVGVFHHLLNPKNGFPINEISQSYVIAKTATESDLYSTVLYLMGKEGLAIINKNKYKGFVVDFKGNIYKSIDFIYY